MSRWIRHSLDGARFARVLPSMPIATMSAGLQWSKGSPVGVMRKPSASRRLRFPAVPTLSPASFIARAVSSNCEAGEVPVMAAPERVLRVCRGWRSRVR